MAKKNTFQVIIDARRAETHRLHISIRALDGAMPSQVVFPVWTPGSYLVREYSRHITGFKGGTKSSKNTWRIDAKAKELSYEVYAFERTVRTSFLDANYATLVGATLLPLLSGSFSVTLLFPTHWNLAASALPLKRSAAGTWKTEVRDIDQWIDSPIIAAAPGYGGSARYRSGGITHELAWVGMECAKPLGEIAKDFTKICDTVLRFFGGAPFKHYTTLLHFGHKLYGGLEHRDSQLSQFDGGAIGDRKEYENLLRLFAHEYFHAWNVKSLRPEALGPFDYSRENYTEDLWFAEGLTDYFDEMIPYLAKLTSKEAYWKSRCKGISQSNDALPAHKRRSLAESSFDAWIRYYRVDEDSVNTDVSYYTKGAQLGLCWDAYLQKKSRGRWTLAKLMRAFWKEFGISATEDLRAAKPGYSRQELLHFAERITKIPQAALVESWVKLHAPLPWQEALQIFKVEWKEKISDFSTHYFGAQLLAKNGALQIAKVYSESAAEQAGLSVGDDILAIGSDRVTELDAFPAILKKYSHQRKLNLTIARLNKIKKIEIAPRKHGYLGQEIEFMGVKK